MGLQRLRPLRRQGLDRSAARQRHRARSSRPRRTPSTCRARSKPGTSILKAHGTWPLARALEPAIHYAEFGFPVAARVASDWTGPRRQARQQPRRDQALSVQRPRAGARRHRQAAGAGRDSEGYRQGRPARVLRGPDRRGHGGDARSAGLGADCRGFRRASRRGGDADLDQLSRHRSRRDSAEHTRAHRAGDAQHPGKFRHGGARSARPGSLPSDAGGGAHGLRRARHPHRRAVADARGGLRR